MANLVEVIAVGTPAQSAKDLLAAFHRGARPPFAECAAALSSLFPLLLQFSSTPHDGEWHAEGDVFIHCGMVMEALYRELDAWGDKLTEEERTILFFGAILHDIAKPVTTTSKEIGGKLRIVAPRHEEIGRAYVAQGLLELGLSYREIREVMGLVGYHQMPKLLVVKSRPPRDFLNLARKTSPKLLFILERADMLGRICKDQDEQLTYLDLFRLEAETLGIWDVPPYREWRETMASSILAVGGVAASAKGGRRQAFFDLAFGESVKDFEGGIITTAEEGVARSYGRREFGELFLLVGPSGSGKSTWAGRNLPDARIISLDELRDEVAGDRGSQQKNGQVRQEARRQLKEALAAKETVVWDATNLRADFRAPIIEIGRDYGALVTLVVFHKPTSEVRQGNAAREHSVPSKVLDEQLERFQWPEEDEGHRFVVVGEGGRVVYRAGYATEDMAVRVGSVTDSANSLAGGEEGG